MKKLNFLFLLFFIPVLLDAQPAFDDCGMNGDAPDSDPVHQQLNRFKNRYDTVLTGHLINAAINDVIAKPGANQRDDERYDSSNAVDMTAWVHDVKLTGSQESCNCKHTGQTKQDVHIELVPTQNSYSTKKILIAEITPRLRTRIFNMLGIANSNTALRNYLLHKQIRIKGLLMFDWEHTDEAWNTNPHNEFGSTHRRAIPSTREEIHPIVYLGCLNCNP